MGMVDALVTAKITKKMILPFNQWPAYEFGIINEAGEQIRNVRSTKEAKSWTSLDRFVARIKRVIVALVGPSDVENAIAVAWLLGGNYNAPTSEMDTVSADSSEQES